MRYNQGMKYEVLKIQIKFGLFLKALRTALGMTQEEMASELSVSRVAFVRWEHGDTTPTDMDSFTNDLVLLIKSWYKEGESERVKIREKQEQI